MFTRIVLVALLSVTSVAVAQQNGWAQVTTSTDGNDVYSIKLHSGEHTLNKQGQPIEVVVGQVTHKQQGTVELLKWYVTDSDCVQGYGNLVILDIDGNYETEAPFAQGGKNIASGIAAVVCAAASAGKGKDESSDTQS